MIGLIAFGIQLSNAQNVKYYSLQKIIQMNNVDTDCHGGQYVNIKEYICFDSDVEGKSVGNGQLYLDKTESNSSEIVYVGNSYHGNARYIFNKDFSTLKVEINPHYIYEYKQTTPPSGTLTCSLIKTSNSGDSSADNVFVPNISFDFSRNPVGGYNDVHNNLNSESTSTHQPYRKFKCAYCKNGRIEKNDNAPASFGQNKPRRRCNECGTTYDPTVVIHYHIQCGHCGGSGYTK